MVGELLRSMVTAARGGDELRWNDNMRSIDCDKEDRIASCVKQHTATIYTHSVVPSTENHSVDIRVLKCTSGRR
jgi:hypothetical protein